MTHLPSNGTTNKVLLSGWLEVVRVRRVPVSRRTEYVVQARCHMTKPRLVEGVWRSDEHFPVVLSGVPARIAIRWSKTRKAPFKASLDGKLITGPDGALHVHIQFVDVLEFSTGTLGDANGGAASGHK